LIFIIIADSLFLIFVAIRHTINKFNNLLDTTEKAADEIQLPLELAMAGVAGLMSKNAFGTVKKFFEIAKTRSSKKSRR
jgi:hypothetical protein